MYCSNCGKKLSETAAFCPDCGKPMLAAKPAAQPAPQPGLPAASGIKRCPQCGKDAAENLIFCASCGAPIPQAAPAQVPYVPPAPIQAPVMQAPPPVQIPVYQQAPAPSQPPVYVQPPYYTQPTAVAQNFSVYTPLVPAKKAKGGKGLAIGFGVGIPLALLVALGIWLGPSLFVKKTSAVVSSKGGDVKLDDLQLSVGSGLKDSLNFTLTSTSPSGDGKPDGLQSALYVIETDEVCDVLVHVRVKLPEGQSADNLMLGVGADYTDSDGKSTHVGYRYMDAAVEGGYAEADITPSDYATQAKVMLPGNPFVAYAAPQNLRVYVGVFQCSAYFAQGGHFKLYYPGAANKAGAQAMLTDLESVYQSFLDAGYSYGKRTSWPMEVDVVNIARGDLGGYLESGFWNAATGRTPEHGWIEINKKLFVGGYQRDQLKPVLGHEWFHFVQSNYESGATNCAWFDDATATYYEGRIKGGTPDIVNEYYMNIFDGVIPKQDTAQEGYARAPLISFLVDKYGGGFMLKTLQGYAKGMPAKDALTAATEDPTLWAGNCYEYLVSGKAGDIVPYTAWSNVAKGDSEYSKIGASMELKYPSAEDIEQAQADGEPITLSSGTVTVPPLGARLLAVTVDDGLKDNLTDGVKLQFKAQSDVDMRLFSIKGSSFSVKKAVDAAVDVDDFKGDLDNKICYLLVITNLSELSAETVSVSAELQAAPTLDELVGAYDDGSLLFADVYISQKLRDEAKQNAGKSADSVGCDLDMIEEFDKLKGQSEAAPFVIKKTSDDTGVISINGQDGSNFEIPFTYSNGTLTVDYTMAASKDTNNMPVTMKGKLNAAYGSSNNVTIDGTMRYSSPQFEGDFYIDMKLTGSHPLPAKS
jgi:hypothetical protein